MFENIYLILMYIIYDRIKYHPKVSNYSTVNHALKEYSNNKSHVNHCECFHSIIKPFLRKHRGVCRKYLHLYVGFYTFIYNYKLNWLYNILNMILGNGI